MGCEARLSLAQARRLCHQVFSWPDWAMAFQRKPITADWITPDSRPNVTDQTFNILIFRFVLTENWKPKTENGIRNDPA
jgi:hypothetical protein